MGQDFTVYDVSHAGPVVPDLRQPGERGPQAELLAVLRAWHDAAGRPSSRAIAVPAGVGHSTVNDLLHGRRIPSWDKFAAIAVCLGGDPEQARELWLAAEPCSGSAWLAAADAEAEAIRVTAAAFSRVGPEGRRRVIAYLQDRFGGEETR